MPTYTPPLRDMQFVMHELFRVTDEFRAMPLHADVDAETINAVLEEAGKFASEVLDPLNVQGDRQGCQCKDGVVTAAVVLLSIMSLVLLIAGGFRRHTLPSLAVWACIALGLMFAGSIGIGAAPKAFFGVFERFSVFSAVGFTAVLGIYLMKGFPSRVDAEVSAQA